MRQMPHLLITCLAFFSTAAMLFSQGERTVQIQRRADIPSNCLNMTLTMQHDQLGRPFLYVANKEAGLKIYDISTLSSPHLVKTLPVTNWWNLHVMNLSQAGNFLYLALGNHFFLNTQSPGLAVVDVTDPGAARVTGTWKFDKPDGGAGIVQIKGNAAYLGAMKHGLIILDIADKSKIRFISQLVPDIHFPDSNQDPKKVNARGMAIRDSRVYLCYDAGGIRVIDVSDRKRPVEIGRYSNPVLNGKPRAYNNIVLDGPLAYVTADYCGIEVLNISNPSSIAQVAWWNPWNCQADPWGWFSSPGHINEIAYKKSCKLLFLSAGKSDLCVLDVTIPSRPVLCGNYGGLNNNMGTYGISLYRDEIFLSYVCSLIPFPSSWTGVQILTYTGQCVAEDTD